MGCFKIIPNGINFEKQVMIQKEKSSITQFLEITITALS